MTGDAWDYEAVIPLRRHVPGPGCPWPDGKCECKAEEKEKEVNA